MDQTTKPDQPNRRRRYFNGKEAGSFDLETAAIWTAEEQARNPGQVRGYFFGREILKKILDQPDCMGLRVYYALDPATGIRHLLVVGADSFQNDQLPLPAQRPADFLAPAKLAAPVAAKQTAVGLIAEMASPCPDQCGKSNPLNGGK